MEYVCALEPGPLGGDQADQKLAAAWVDKLNKWDGNLFIAANGDPGRLAGARLQYMSHTNIVGPVMHGQVVTAVACMCIQ
jgi:hypothetical protein